MYFRLTRGQFDPARNDAIRRVIPDVITAIRALPGVQNVQVGRRPRDRV